jgi:putative MATE family efflux protein
LRATGGYEKTADVQANSGDAGDPEDAPISASLLLDLRDKPPEPLAPSPQALGVWELAWPTMASLLTQTVVRWADFVMVGSLGPAALAAVGLGGQTFWLFQSVSFVVPTGVVALLARAVGARNDHLADAALRQGIWLASVLALVTAVVGLPFTDWAIALYGVEADVVEMGSSYIFWLLLGNVPMAIALMFGASLRAAGDARTPLAIGVVANLLNLFLNWVLIFGNLGAPALGVSGAGIASSLAMVFQVVVFWPLWRGHRLVLAPAGASFRPDRRVLRRITRIGYPAVIEGGLFHVGLLLFQRLMANYGTVAIAAYSVGAQILSVSFLPGVAFGTAASTLVGQHLGSGDPDGAKRAGWRALRGAVVSMTVMGALVIAFAAPIAGMFSDDPKTVALTIDFIWILGAVQPLMAVEFALGGALRGAGDTRFPLLAVFTGLFLFRLIPASIAAVVFSASLQVVWCALMLDYAIKAAMLIARFVRGRWKRVEV